MLTFILSLPRSGSTVLTSLLDRRKGVVCPPESSFPQLLSQITPEERGDRRRLAALYLGSTFSGPPMTLEDAETCMEGSDDEILTAIGKKLAENLGRDPENVTAVVWKTTRTIGMNAGLLRTKGRFVVLRRNPVNVFESQFRVNFGRNNRKPFRFAFFRESYEYAFSKLPGDRTLELKYDEIPERMEELVDFLGIEGADEWEGGSSSLEQVAERRPWLTQIMHAFENRDEEKRARIEPALVGRLERAMRVARVLRPALGPVRRMADWRSFGHIRTAANGYLEDSHCNE